MNILVSPPSEPHDGPSDIIEITTRRLDGGETIKAFTPDPLLQSWDETCAVAEAQQEDWFLDQWAEFGSLLLLTGREFSGKSLVVAELCAAIGRGTSFAGIAVRPVPFILFDFENRERITVTRIRRALEGRGDIRPFYHRIRPNAIKRPLTSDCVKAAIESVERKNNATRGKGVVWIDTLRSASLADTLSEKEMIAHLIPLKDLAAETGWLIGVIHHNAKHSDQYSGTTAIGAIADYLWNWKRDEHLNGTLLLDGTRGDQQKPLRFKFDLDQQRNVLVAREADDEQIGEAIRQSLKGTKREMDEIVKAVQHSWQAGNPPGVNKIKAKVRAMAERTKDDPLGQIVSHPTGTKGKLLYSLDVAAAY